MFRVFKKASSDGRITVYLGRRDFVDHVTGSDPIDGVVNIDRYAGRRGSHIAVRVSSGPHHAVCKKGGRTMQYARRGAAQCTMQEGGTAHMQFARRGAAHCCMREGGTAHCGMREGGGRTLQYTRARGRMQIVLLFLKDDISNNGFVCILSA